MGNRAGTRGGQTIVGKKKKNISTRAPGTGPGAERRQTARAGRKRKIVAEVKKNDNG